MVVWSQCKWLKIESIKLFVDISDIRYHQWCYFGPKRKYWYCKNGCCCNCCWQLLSEYCCDFVTSKTLAVCTVLTPSQLQIFVFIVMIIIFDPLRLCHSLHVNWMTWLKLIIVYQLWIFCFCPCCCPCCCHLLMFDFCVFCVDVCSCSNSSDILWLFVVYLVDKDSLW